MTRIPEEFPGLRVANPDGEGLLLYDGACGFCRAMVKQAQRLARRPLRFLPLAQWHDQLPAEVRDTGQNQMLWMEPDGTIWGGSRALVRFLRHAGRPLLAGLLGAPGVRWFTWAAYRFIAHHRFRLSRMKGDACEP